MTLPNGFRVRLAPGVLRLQGARLLVGGSPLVALRLSERAGSMFDRTGVTVRDLDSGRLAARLLATNLAFPDLEAVPASAQEELTVVIPVRDRPVELERALSALAPLRCIVVDDASRDVAATSRVAQRHAAGLICLPENVGPAAARNAGLARVETPYVAFVDSDIEINAIDLLRLTRHFADPAVAVVGPRVEGHARSPEPRWFERYDAAASSLSLGVVPGVVRPGAAVGWLPSACLVGRTAELAGGFDETLRVGEDVDLVWRTVASGGTVRYDPTVVARHDVRPTIRGWLGRKFVYGTGGAVLAQRHGDLVAPAVLSPLSAAAAFGLLARRRWAIPLAVLAVLDGARTVRNSLPDSANSSIVAEQLATRGLGWAVRQESSLLLRHWWPLAALAATRSSSIRRGVVTAIAVDTAFAVAEQRRRGRPLPLGTLVVGRRLDDVSYGAGLWWGAIIARSPRALLPRRPRPQGRRP